MPELPEVETVRRGLEKLILGKKISSIEIRYPKMIKTDLDEFRKEVPAQIVESMGRRGKYLIFYLTEKVLISHLRMEGKYFYYPDQVPERKHAHVFFQFEDGGTTFFNSLSQNSNGLVMNGSRFFCCQSLGRSGWMNLSSPENLIHIDIAKSSNQGLV